MDFVLFINDSKANKTADVKQTLIERETKFCGHKAALYVDYRLLQPKKGVKKKIMWKNKNF